MSMNVDAADPDLPSFNSGGIGMPSVAPTAAADENDTSRLFWVPARLHPELAPKDYRTFVEDRVDRIKKTSTNDEDSLSPNGVERQGSAGSNPNRRRSMLSKTVEVPSDFKDGADVLERKRSDHHRTPSAETSLQELESLVNDPSSLVRKMSLDASRRSMESNPESPEDDMPILPVPAGQTLKRSTRTQYRRGSLRNQGRGGRRAGMRSSEKDNDSATSSVLSTTEVPPVPSIPEEKLSRIRTEPTPEHPDPNDQQGFGSVQSKTRQALHAASSLDDMHNEDGNRHSLESDRPQHRPFHSRIASNGRTTAQVPGYSGPAAATPVPEIVHTPPDSRHSLPALNPAYQLPERNSSHEFSRSNSLPSTPAKGAAGRPAFSRSKQPQQEQSLDDMASHSSHTMGTNTNTDALSFIPTLPDEQKSEKQGKKSKPAKDLHESTSGPRKGSWGWFRGGDDKKKEDREEERASKKSKGKVTKGVEKAHDTTRLDVLHTATDGPRGRESLVLSRDDSSSSRLDEERRKDNARRSGATEGKKEKEGIFSSLFGGKKKGDRDSGGRKTDKIRGLSPEPPRRILRADIDYNWTRFSILEERAIYRMAHIKLANPRRALYSQVLLSNFMYSYLAKVQQMHPQIQIPAYAQQKNGNPPPQSQQKESEEMLQWQRYQEVCPHVKLVCRGINAKQQQGQRGPDASYESNGASFIDDYDPEHQQAEDARHAYGDGAYGDERQWEEHDADPYARQGLFDEDRPPDENDMW